MQKLWAIAQFSWRGIRTFGEGGFQQNAATWDDREMDYDVSFVFSFKGWNLL
jgi:hypothetical protein